MKKYVIVKPNCRELANHLWNYLSIYAYGIETGGRVFNPSFFEWHQYFNLIKKESFITGMTSYFPALKSVWRTICALYGSYLIRARARCVRLTLGITTFLPPTRPPAGEDTCETTYFIGWHFRNPVGLRRHRDTIIAAFTPKDDVLGKIGDTLAPFREKRLIGVHLRQQPYKGFPDGDFLISISRVRRIINEYLREKKLDAKDVALIIVSDKNINRTAFSDFTTHISHENEVTNLFLLSKCGIIIGSNSTFSNLAAWFGDVPHIVTTNEPMDWDYYRTPTTYFENKYAMFAQ